MNYSFLNPSLIGIIMDVTTLEELIGLSRSNTLSPPDIFSDNACLNERISGHEPGYKAEKDYGMMEFYFNRVNLATYNINLVSHFIAKNNLGAIKTEEHYCLPVVKAEALLKDPSYKVVTFLSEYEHPSYQLTKIDEEANFYICIQLTKNSDEDTYVVSGSVCSDKDFGTFATENEFAVYADYLKTNSIVYVNWYLGKDPRGEMIFKKVPLNCSRSIYDSYYPSICEKYDLDLNKFIEEFKNSEESILILSGIKGSGKTELIRQMASQFNTDVTLTFDKHVMMDNTFYSEFFTSSQSDLMVIEDADTLLSKRSDGNPIMDLFLNLSDGLISSPKKKFIFTSNLPNLSSIDEALLRKGRCFASIEFEHLTEIQAKEICKDTEVDYEKVIENSDPKQLTLSSIMAVKNNTLGSQIKEPSIDKSRPKTSFGFG